MKRNLFAFVSVLACLGVAFFLGACNGDDDDKDVNVTVTNPPPAAPEAALEAPEQVDPPDGWGFIPGGLPMDVTLEWAAVAGAESYFVEIDQAAGDNLTVVTGSTSTTYSAPVLGAYRWRVWAADDDGNQGPKSGWSDFQLSV
ncbi:MAG: hypothetical protein V1873_05180 [Verrucomicrobiota bacterium]